MTSHASHRFPVWKSLCVGRRPITSTGNRSEMLAPTAATGGIQIAHSGRKGSVSRPWEGTQPLSEADGAWETLCPSAVPFGDRKTALREMDGTLIAEVIHAFHQSTRRARDAGFKILELHAAHGYLINEFLSPLSNKRTGHGHRKVDASGPTETSHCFLS